MDRIYLDNAATTAVSQPVMEAMLPYYMQVYGNPSSIHSTGRDAKKAVERARRRLRIRRRAGTSSPRRLSITPSCIPASGWKRRVGR